MLLHVRCNIVHEMIETSKSLHIHEIFPLKWSTPQLLVTKSTKRTEQILTVILETNLDTIEFCHDRFGYKI
jgi:hypothetical protein